MANNLTSDRLIRVLLVVLAVVILFPILLMAFMMPMMGMMGWWSEGMMSGSSALWTIGMMLIWLGVLVAIGYFLYQLFTGGGRLSPTSTTDPAIEELRLAYARGDLTEEEFEERREKLTRED